jgi:methyl-CpG-binding domain protein 4
MTDDEGGSKFVHVDDTSRDTVFKHEPISGGQNDMSDVEDWASIEPQALHRSGCIKQNIEVETLGSSMRSFRESQGLARCSIKANANLDRPKKKAKDKGRKSRAIAKNNQTNGVVPNTQSSTLNDSPELESSRSRPSEQAIVPETQSSPVSESSLSQRPTVGKICHEKQEACNRVGPAYDECSTRGVDFPWEREGASHEIPSKPPVIFTSQHSSDKAMSPEKLAANLPQPVTPSKRKTGTTSQFFDTPSPSKKPRPATDKVSCIDVPPITNPVFGLIQEELAHKPFQLLVAAIFLNKTRGKYAIPVFREVIKTYPTTQALENADPVTLSEMIRPLGLFNQRAATLVSLAKVWNLHPPTKGRRVMTPKYPGADSHKGIKPLEVLGDDDSREGALEIGHLPGIGAYAFDSWRIFCRDKLREVATGWNGEETADGFEPEWKRVLPNDKELRAYLRWMWLKEGFKWNPVTGDKGIASEELMKRAESGGLDWDEVDAKKDNEAEV